MRYLLINHVSTMKGLNHKEKYKDKDVTYINKDLH